MTANNGEALREVVREKYGAAAARVADGETAVSACGSSGCCGDTTAAWIPSHPTCTMRVKPAGSPPKHFSPRSAAATPPCSLLSKKAKSCSTSAPAVA